MVERLLTRGRDKAKDLLLAGLRWVCAGEGVVVMLKRGGVEKGGRVSKHL